MRVCFLFLFYGNLTDPLGWVQQVLVKGTIVSARVRTRFHGFRSVEPHHIQVRNGWPPSVSSIKLQRPRWSCGVYKEPRHTNSNNILDKCSRIRRVLRCITAYVNTLIEVRPPRSSPFVVPYAINRVGTGGVQGERPVQGCVGSLRWVTSAALAKHPGESLSDR